MVIGRASGHDKSASTNSAWPMQAWETGVVWWWLINIESLSRSWQGSLFSRNCLCSANHSDNIQVHSLVEFYVSFLCWWEFIQVFGIGAGIKQLDASSNGNHFNKYLFSSSVKKKKRKKDVKQLEYSATLKEHKTFFFFFFLLTLPLLTWSRGFSVWFSLQVLVDI